MIFSKRYNIDIDKISPEELTTVMAKPHQVGSRAISALAWFIKLIHDNAESSFQWYSEYGLWYSVLSNSGTIRMRQVLYTNREPVYLIEKSFRHCQLYTPIAHFNFLHRPGVTSGFGQWKSGSRRSSGRRVYLEHQTGVWSSGLSTDWRGLKKHFR